MKNSNLQWNEIPYFWTSRVFVTIDSITPAFVKVHLGTKWYVYKCIESCCATRNTYYQTVTFSTFLENSKLLKTIFHTQVTNNQLEVDSISTCLGIVDKKESSDQSHSSEENCTSIEPLILQSSLLEDSNFKDQFFITRSSFQVIHNCIC